MKKIFTLALLFLAAGAFAQKVKVKESKENIGGGNNNAMVITVYEASPDDILKEFKSIMKDYDCKVSSKDGGLFGDNGVVKKMSNNTVDIYAKVEKVKDGESKFIVAFDLSGSGNWLNSNDNKEQYAIAKDIVENFAIKMQKEAIEAQLAAANKILEKMTDQQKDLEKKNANLKDDIKEYQDKIKKAEDEIKVNEGDQTKKKSEIEGQTKIVNAIKDKQKAVE